MSAGHTPGPWLVSGVRMTSAPQIGRDTRLLSVGPDGDALALVFFDMKTARGQADARLISSAPDMLVALEKMKDILRQLQPALNIMARDVVDDIIKDQIDPAIAKATGAK